MDDLARALRAGTLFRGWRGDVLALVAGLPLVLGFAPFGYYGVPVVCFVFFLLTLEGVAPRRALRRGFLFGIGSFLTGLYWIHISIHEFGGAPISLALGLMFALVLYMAVYPAVFAYALNRLCPDTGPLRVVAAAPGLWVLTEWLRGTLFSGFGWLSLGYSQSDGVLRHLHPVLGVHGASLAVVVLAGGLVGALVLARRRWLPIVVAAIVLVASGLLGSQVWTTPNGETIDVALVQGSVPQEDKWKPEMLQPTVELYLDLTGQHLDADLVIWPEAAIPTARHNLENVFNALRRRGEANGTDFLIGTVVVDAQTDARLNTVAALGATPDAETRYVKRHLVPYGEYFPVPALVRRWIQWMNLPYQDFTSGADDQPPLRAAGVEIAMSICYEDVFGDEMRLGLPQASMLANVSNDAWFGASVAPHQHLQIARVRAQETGRMMMRATNNGISALIDEEGRVVQRSGQFVPEVLRVSVRGFTGVTPFVRRGSGPVLIASVLLVVFTGLIAMIRRVR